MASWQEIEKEVPELAGRVRELLDAHRHKTMATLRRDGSPRISGTEARFKDGELWLGSMPGSVKAKDLRRDPRLALHSASEDPDDENPSRWAGDAKLAGRAVEVTDPQVLGRFELPEGQESHLFRIDVTEVVRTFVDADGEHLVIQMWHEGRGFREVRRR
ncbi:pyridoxamine 5'-phosphate oxidase family protein [Planomonospora sp. ID91781]|uniref:pyridoxamine 5'-phosphate oxidase family protein n=1 Tax=Planomonospora sp. ID91781 TaxID=2738135 RepID=UPI0018C3CB12|nr:pyridoxamine 5'-phosphate oxidase family protein [Planomonospora sp. ID91781]MBG0823232.1 pyridoxamine 5'-phosphate oxidase family protein [Planomonospora sp. ID91781]